VSRQLNETDKEILDKIIELQLLIANRLAEGKVSDISMGQNLVNDVQIIRHIWTKDKGSI